MIARHIHHALAQVRDLQHQLVEKQRFKGYSGRARAASGCIALTAAIVMSSPKFPPKASWHAAGWGVAFLLGFAINFGALVYWFFFDPDCKRDIRRLKPLVDAVPPFFAGALFTYVFVLNGLHQFLPGTWMILFGLANLASRHVLPSSIVFVGLFYVASGTVCLLLPGLSLTDPWPTGLVFFIGEWAAGWILHYDSATNASYNQMVHQILGRGDTDV
jgi:hypothetical protein